MRVRASGTPCSRNDCKMPVCCQNARRPRNKTARRMSRQQLHSLQSVSDECPRRRPSANPSMEAIFRMLHRSECPALGNDPRDACWRTALVDCKRWSTDWDGADPVWGNYVRGNYEQLKEIDRCRRQWWRAGSDNFRNQKRKCMGIEPTGDAVNTPPNGFEDRGHHQVCKHFRPCFVRVLLFLLYGSFSSSVRFLFIAVRMPDLNAYFRNGNRLNANLSFYLPCPPPESSSSPACCPVFTSPGRRGQKTVDRRPAPFTALRLQIPVAHCRIEFRVGGPVRQVLRLPPPRWRLRVPTACPRFEGHPASTATSKSWIAAE